MGSTETLSERISAKNSYSRDLTPDKNSGNIPVIFMGTEIEVPGLAYEVQLSSNRHQIAVEDRGRLCDAILG